VLHKTLGIHYGKLQGILRYIREAARDFTDMLVSYQVIRVIRVVRVIRIIRVHRIIMIIRVIRFISHWGN
jgi:hypothetical protein